MVVSAEGAVRTAWTGRPRGKPAPSSDSQVAPASFDRDKCPSASFITLEQAYRRPAPSIHPHVLPQSGMRTGFQLFPASVLRRPSAPSTMKTVPRAAARPLGYGPSSGASDVQLWPKSVDRYTSWLPSV